jgi:hypothetical protein
VIDVSDLEALGADLLAASVTVDRRAREAVQSYLDGTVRDARASAPEDSGTYVQSITGEVAESGGTIVGEVGPELGLPHGRLGPFLEYGTSTMAPQAHLGPAHDRQVPAAVKAIEDIGGSIL